MIIKIFDYLYENEIEVYFVGQHKGECKKPYVVLKDDGINSSDGKRGKGYIDILFLYLKINLLNVNHSKVKLKI